MTITHPSTPLRPSPPPQVYDTFGLDYKMALSTRPEGYLGELEVRGWVVKPGLRLSCPRRMGRNGLVVVRLRAPPASMVPDPTHRALPHPVCAALLMLRSVSWCAGVERGRDGAGGGSECHGP